MTYEIGPFRLDPRAKVLTRDGEPTPLGERGVTLLHVLVDHAQQYVPKATLMDAAWPRVIVEESNLAVQISAIRRVLAAGGGQRWIETLPRRGYRFVGPLRRPLPGITPQPARGNLPPAHTSFIGREGDLQEVARVLQMGRLLTLVGTGGIGKTRLSLQAATAAGAGHAEGAWFVELAAVRDPLRVAAAVAQALGVPERGAQPIAETLGTYLASRDLLLVLDNCEQVRDAVAHLAAQLLSSAPTLRIVATSREPLGIDGETVYPLASLSLPQPDAPADRIGQSEAVRLFVARAVEQQPDFALDARTAATVARICTQLDGLPLALELAAARVRTLAVEQIAVRLDDRFRLLAAGPVARPRHQTLRAVLEWSFDLLAADERAVLRRLAVFAGGFTVASAMAVAADAELDEVAVVDVLARLVRRSLVVADADTATDVGPRHRLLETTRAFALEKLDEAAEAGALRRRHAQHFAERFAAADGEWLSTADSAWWATYLPELDNVRAALDWAFGGDGDAALGIALVATSSEIWKATSARLEGRQWIDAAMAQVDASTPLQQQAQLSLQLARVSESSQREVTFRALERAVALFRQADDRVGLIQACTTVAQNLAIMGDAQAAGRRLADAAALLSASLPPRLHIAYHDACAFVAFLRSDLAGARASLERALDVARTMGAERFTVFTLSHLGDVHWTAGDLDRAEACLREAIALAVKLPRVADDALSNCKGNLIGVLVEKGRVDEPLALARETPAFRTDQANAWHAMDHLALRALFADRAEAAARLAGYTDARYAQASAPRQRSEQRARDRVAALLGSRYAAEELAALLAAGAALTDAAACELALRA